MRDLPAGPALSVDTVVFTILDDDLKLLLIRRGFPPFEGRWALPGGFVQLGESLEAAARRELFEETSVQGLYLEQLHTFGEPGRDPRGRVVSVAYLALIAAERRTLLAATDAVEAAWHSAYRLPELAFDHASIVSVALTHLRAQLAYTAVGFELLGPRFTLSELQRVHEIILGRELDKRNFRKRMLGLEILEPQPESRMEGPHRPARLYAFKPR